MKKKAEDFFLAWRFARRELRGGTRGFYIFIACLMLGVATIAGVQSLSLIMKDALYHDGRLILGGDISLRQIYRPATAEQFKFLQKMAPVTVVAETRAMARREDETKATMVELKAVDPFYPLYGKMKFVNEAGDGIETPMQELLLPPHQGQAMEDYGGDWGALVEKELLPRLGLKIGDRIFVGQKQFQIRGIIAHEPDRVGSSRYTLAPRVMISRYIVHETGLSGEGNQIYYDYRIMLPAVKTYADLLAVQDKIKEAFPKASWRGRNFYDASPRIKRTIDQLTMFLTLIGLTTLLIGGVGVSNAVRGFLDGKLGHIATLKCLGASSRFALNVYLIQIFHLAFLGILCGLLLGLWGASFAGRYLTDYLSLNFYAAFHPEALLLAGVFGVLTVLCFALWPLGRAVAVRPRDLFRDLVAPSGKRPSLKVILVVLIAAQILALLAIVSSSDQKLAVWFCGGTVAAFLVFYLYAAAIKALMKRIRVPERPEWRMAIANLYRPGNISTNIVLSLGLGLTVLSAISLVEYNMSRLLREDLAVDAPSFFFLDIQPGDRDAFAQTIEAVPGLRALQMTPSYRGRIVRVNGVAAEEALKDESESWVIRSDRGFTYTSTQPDYSEITQGEWWAADFNSAEAGVEPIISISTDVAKAFDIGVGAELTMNIMGVDVTAKVANVREINWASFTMNFAVTFAPGALDNAPANIIATAVVPEDREEELQNAIARDFPGVTSVRVREALQAIEKLLSGVLTAVRAAAGVTLTAGLLVLAGGIAAARRRYFYDAVILKVLGASRVRILKTFLYEYLLLGSVTILIAAGFGTASAYGIVTGVMELEWKFSATALAGVAALCLSMTLLAGFLGTFGALARKAAPYLRNQ